jgi:Tfp pilus assembly protein PilF
MLRVIREDEAPPLPRRLTSMGASATQVAERRRTDPATLRRLVDGDLNWITMKALEKTRKRRYASVADLAGDIQRHMEDRPVLASPPGRVYRARKFFRRHKLAALATAAGIIVFALSGVTAWSLSHSASRPKLTDKDTIVLADFDNKTGDPVFDGTLRQGLSIELQQSPFLSLIGDQQVEQTLALMGQPKDARLTTEIAQQICERTGSAAVLEGSIASLGSQYVVGLQAKTCGTGNMLDQEQAQASSREDVLNTLSQIARKFRTRVGESLAMVEQHSTPLQEATTPSLEALKAYSAAIKMNLPGGDSTAGRRFLRQAIEIDPQFAIAYANLGLHYSGDGESVLSAESSTRAWQLRDRASDREKFFIDFIYNRQVTGNLEKAHQTLESWLQTYPRGDAPPSPHDLLGGLSEQGTGRFDRAIETSQKEVAERPDLPFGYGNLASSYFYRDNFTEADAILQRAAERKMLNRPNQLLLRYEIAALKGDQGQMDRIAALAKGRQGAEHGVTNAEALFLARSGQLAAARLLSNQAIDLAMNAGDDETAAVYRAARGVWEAIYGNSAEGKSSATAALKLSKGRDVQYAAGLALAFSGDSSQAEELAAGLEKRFQEDTFVKFTYVPVLRAAAALGRGKPADIVPGLEVTRPYERAVNGLNYNHFYLGGLHSAYLRGEAFAAAQHYSEAAAEFQKILDNRGIVGMDPIGALAHLQLGRVYALLGDKAKAKAAYDAFLALWKDANPAVPILKSAKAEYSRL